MYLKKARTFVTLCCLGLAVAACDTADERSAAHYEKGLELISSGDTTKAMLEFRNALKLNQDFVEPRFEMAKLLMEQQDFRGALGNFLRVVELEPEHLETRTNLARIFVYGQQWDDAKRHIDEALTFAPDNTEVRALSATVEYRQGDKDKALEIARSVLKDEPENGPAAVVLIGHEINEKNFPEAMRLSEEALVQNPKDQGINFLKLAILEQMGDAQGVGAHLDTMTGLFPKNRNIAQSLVQWHMQQNDEAGAEKALREIYTRFPEDSENALNIVRFLRQTKGIDTARVEMLRLSEGDQHRPIFQRALASFDFQNGQPEQAISILENALGTIEDEAEKRQTQTTLANMLRSEGRNEEAQALVETVLAGDAENVSALQLRASYAIDADRPEDAIQDLRTALGANPQDPDILALLASAHERNGSRGLAQERLALAVQVSESAPEISIRYAQFLLRDNKADVAASVLTDSLARNPTNPRLLMQLARLRLRLEDWTGARQLAAQLESIGTDQAKNMAKAIEASVRGGQDDFAGTVALIEEMRESGSSLSASLPALVQTYLRAGNPEQARLEIEKLLEQEPDDLRTNLTLGQFEAQQGNLAAAEKHFARMVSLYPEQAASYLGLASVLRQDARPDEAAEVVKTGADTARNPGRLMFDRASYLEAQGDIDGALELYETLYEANNTSEVIANNLASLLSEHRADPESQERAFAVAKRLRSSEVAAFQDTYGWLLYKRGEYERAIVYFTKAVEGGLGEHPLVQYHLGMTLAAIERVSDAKTHLSRALELAKSNGDQYPQLDEARKKLAELGG